MHSTANCIMKGNKGRNLRQELKKAMKEYCLLTCSFFGLLSQITQNHLSLGEFSHSSGGPSIPIINQGNTPSPTYMSV